MSRSGAAFEIEDSKKLKHRLLAWANDNFDTVCYLDNNDYAGYSYHTFEAVLALGEKDAITCNYGNAF